MARSTHRPVPRHPGPTRPPAWAAAVLLVATGCTICPDPFDYTGPVPNGSAPQNDFRARSNGIAPLGGVPRPWPPVVQDTTTPADDAAPTALAANVEAEADAEADREPDAETLGATAAAEEPAPVRTAAAAEAPPAAAEEPAVQPVAEEPRLEQLLPPVSPPRREAGPPLRETPGWKPRG